MEVAGDVGKISKAEILREIITEKLSTAAREILAVVERTVVGYEEEAAVLRMEMEQQRRQLEVLQPRVKLELLDAQFPVCEPPVGGAAEFPEEDQEHKYEPRNMLLKAKLGEVQKYVRLTEPTLKEFLTAAFAKFGVPPVTEGVTVVDGSGTEVDNDVFEDVARDPSTGVLVIQYDTESVSMVTSPLQCQSSVPDSSDSYNAVVTSEGPSRKRQRLDKEAKQLVESVLSKQPGGERIVNEYKRTRSLVDESRRKMVNILAAHMTEKNGTSPPRHVKEMYARGIVTLFPHLSDPYSKNGYETPVRVRSTKRGQIPLEVYERAFLDVSCEGVSIRSAAKAHDVSHVTLARYCSRRRAAGGMNARPPGYWHQNNKVFTVTQERRLQTYLQTAAEIYFGLSPKEVRKFAYELARRFDCKYPAQWDKNQMAGKDWFSSFLARNTTLAIRRPQASFSRTNMTAFFNNLKAVLSGYHFEAKDIWTMDETVRGEGVGAVTSAETGASVTVVFAGNARGDSVPPFFIFPGEKIQEQFMRDGPAGSAGSANSSGRMQEVDFLAFLHHFTRHTGVKVESKLLLLLDNHPSHLSMAAIDFCESHDIVLLSFPPHCSRHLQPLDGNVCGPLKRYVNSAADDWTRTHPGETISIYDIPGLVAKFLPLAATSANIRSGFERSGIWPFNPHVFGEAVFSPSNVSERPALSASPEDGLTSALEESIQSAASVPDQHASASDLLNGHTTGTQQQVSTPESSEQDACPRKGGRRRGRRRSAAVLTSTPVKVASEEE